METSVVTLKAFGDFVIACHAVGNLSPTPGKTRPTIIAGEHVRGLAASLGVSDCVTFIGGKDWVDVPAAFDLKKRGLRAGFYSLTNMVQAIGKVPATQQLVFDNLGWRERCIGVRHAKIQLDKRIGNIYLAYEDLFEEMGFSVKQCRINRQRVRNAAIFPAARHPSRIIPEEEIEYYARQFEKIGVNSTVVLTSGDGIRVPSVVNRKVIPKNFSALIAEIRSSDVVVCGDSLPAHLAQFLGVPMFVTSPVPNTYWLPKFAYVTGGWDLFKSGGQFWRWLLDSVDII